MVQVERMRAEDLRWDGMGWGMSTQGRGGVNIGERQELKVVGLVHLACRFWYLLRETQREVGKFGSEGWLRSSVLSLFSGTL